MHAELTVQTPKWKENQKKKNLKCNERRKLEVQSSHHRIVVAVAPNGSTRFLGWNKIVSKRIFYDRKMVKWLKVYPDPLRHSQTRTRGRRRQKGAHNYIRIGHVRTLEHYDIHRERKEERERERGTDRNEIETNCWLAGRTKENRYIVWVY